MPERITPRDLCGFDPQLDELLAVYLLNVQKALQTDQAIPADERKIAEGIQAIQGADEFCLKRLLDEKTGCLNQPAETALSLLKEKKTVWEDYGSLYVDPPKIKSIERTLGLTAKGVEVLEQAAKAAVLVWNR